MKTELPAGIGEFLGGATPQSWLDMARNRIPELLIDHAQCEKKAAQSALQLMFRYPEDEELAAVMSRLAREELRHFEQVLNIMQQKGIADRRQSASRYASELRSHVRNSEPDRLVDILLVGAFIEARSCERFASLIPYLDNELARFYRGLLESEGRHYQRYIDLAKERWLIHQSLESCEGIQNGASDSFEQQSQEARFEQRINYFRNIELNLIESEDGAFRFHSGMPTSQV